MTTVVSLAERPDLRDSLPFGEGWPEFIFHDPIASRHVKFVQKTFADYDLVVLDEGGRVIAGGWGVPLPWDGTLEGLPRGWDGAMERCIEAHTSQQTTTTLCAMATEVPSPHRGKGLSRMVLSAL